MVGHELHIPDQIDKRWINAKRQRARIQIWLEGQIEGDQDDKQGLQASWISGLRFVLLQLSRQWRASI